MLRSCFAAGFVCVLLGSIAFGQQDVTDRVGPKGVLGEGQPWAIPWYETRGEKDGPTVIVAGGVHGNEPAGANAAAQIRFWPLRSGRLIVIPRVNRLGLAANMRWFPPTRNDRKRRDLNRNFPNADDPAPRGPLAEAVWEFVRQVKPDYVVDLHEGFDFHATNKKSVGSSIICSPGEKTVKLAKRMHRAINVSVTDANRRFDLLNKSGAASGSLVRACADRLGIPAFILETTFKDQPLSLRTAQHRLMVATLLSDLRMARDWGAHIVGPAEPSSILRIGLYDGDGTSAAGLKNLATTFDDIDQFAITHIGVDDVDAEGLSRFDVVIFPGGSGSKQGKALRERRRKAVQDFVRSGGGVVGICAGGYLCSSHYDWSLNVINTAVYNKMEDIPGVGRKSMWYRGNATDVKMEPTAAGQELLGLSELTTVRFENGPIVSRGRNTDLGDYKVLAWFRSEVAKYDAQKGTMIDTPAIITSTFGKGRVLSISPHPEASKALRPVVIRGVRWAANAELAR